VYLNDWFMVISTLLSPLIALQVSEWISRRRSTRDEQMKTFRALMATRASNLDHRHVESLNMIDVVFSGTSRKQVEIRRLWKQYLDHLSDKNYPQESWGVRRVDLMVDLLQAIAAFLDFDLDKTHIKNQCYYPEGYGNLENDQGDIRRGLADILSGKRPLQMWVANLPRPQDPALPPDSERA
jgi:hypothetical protein